MAEFPQLGEDEHQDLDVLESLEGVGDDYLQLGGRLPAADDDSPAAVSVRDAMDAEGIGADELASALTTGNAVLDRFVPALARAMLEAMPAVLDSQTPRVERPTKLVDTIIALGRTDDERPGALRWMDATRTLPVLALLQDDEAASSLDREAVLEHLKQGLQELRETCVRARARIEEDPRAAWAMAPAISSATQVLAISRESMMDGMLRHRASRAPSTPEVERCATIINRWIRAAYLKGAGSENTSAEPTAPELVRFRLALLEGAGNEVRATALAADHPDRIGVAREVARKVPEHGAAIAAFAQAVAELELAERVENRPGRRFTWVHAGLFLLLLGIAVWHYWLR